MAWYESNFNKENLNTKQFKKQIKASYEEKIVIEKLEKNTQIATIVGSTGKYITTLSNCECDSFTKEHVPCKHMYKLAYTLGLLNPLPKINESKIIPFVGELLKYIPNDNYDNVDILIQQLLIQGCKELYNLSDCDIKKLEGLLKTINSKTPKN